MKRNNNQGFSLVELLIAIAILSLIMIALASFMGTTTNSYVRTRNDREIQQAGQEVFDMIADKLMQAKLVRIGTDDKEYTAIGTGGSVSAGGDFALLDENGAPIATSYGNRSRYSFGALGETTITDSNPIRYIAIIYDVKITSGANKGTYGPARAVYCFKDGNVYLFQGEYASRPSSYNDGSNTEVDQTLAELEPTLDSLISTSLNKVNSTAQSDYTYIQDNNLVCNTIMHDGDIPAVNVYALPAENALYMTLDFEKQGMENRTEGMITIRNSYVLQPRKLPTADGSSSASGSSMTPPTP
ncbi:MAG: prepilin-type N-terminal cleavage/methylation domain-containing protein [Bacteroides sp.]|nr:prepilin-type N-terminal cleavage/methylation domain-containing protein [Bacteroides sp.]MCM1548602.1 prepilin-type N-terminal cleavage/methylation domain-containing protein [Clostridium sp.]